MSNFALPELSPAVLKKTHHWSGICPPQAWAVMLLLGLPLSFGLGLLCKYVFGFLNIIISLLPLFIYGLVAWYSKFWAIVFICFFLALFFFVYPMILGSLAGIASGYISKFSHNRNPLIWRGFGLAASLCAYAGYLYIPFSRQQVVYPILASVADITSMGFGLQVGYQTLPGLYIFVAVLEAGLAAYFAFRFASQMAEEETYCETHKTWHAQEKIGFISEADADLLVAALESENHETLKSIHKFSSEDYPHLEIKTRHCPVEPACQVDLTCTLAWLEFKTDKRGKTSETKKKETWFKLLVPAAFGQILEETLALQPSREAKRPVAPPVKNQPKPNQVSLADFVEPVQLKQAQTALPPAEAKPFTCPRCHQEGETMFICRECGQVYPIFLLGFGLIALVGFGLGYSGLSTWIATQRFVWLAAIKTFLCGGVGVVIVIWMLPELPNLLRGLGWKKRHETELVQLLQVCSRNPEASLEQIAKMQMQNPRQVAAMLVELEKAQKIIREPDPGKQV